MHSVTFEWILIEASDGIIVITITNIITSLFATIYLLDRLYLPNINLMISTWLISFIIIIISWLG